ncbi:MAG: PLP-dependent aspartate aminotransferase family protein [Acidobacteriota bacterium]|nr:PLP-dependent aspartate aminotransferase family protein [Acidobacteriota bacterium]
MSKQKPQRRPETRAVHDGLDFRDQTGAVVPPIYATSTFLNGNRGGFDYTRSGNPNFNNLEAVLAGLDEAEFATSFSSGVAAITAVVSSLKLGDLIIAEENIYGCTFRLFHQVFEKFGLRVLYLDLTQPSSLDKITFMQPEMVWLESPTNPLLKVIDIAAVAERTRQAGATLLVDNTFSSPLVQQPLTLGADLCLSSTTKYVNGHSDCLGGVVCTNDERWAQKMVFAQKALGLNPSPFDAWLITRGVKTLGARMERHAKNALQLARYLENKPGTRRVRYPFLPSHPQYQLARRQMRSGSGILTVDLGLSLKETRKFLQRLQLFAFAESLGGVESLVCHPASMTHASVPKEVRERVGVTDGLVRFSVGIEHVDDLIEDIENAMEGVKHEKSACIPSLARS